MEKPSASVYVGCMNVMNTVTHVLMGGAGFFGIAIGEMGFLRKFSAHTFLSVIGLTILCSQAILLVNPYRGSKDSLKYSKKTKTYWIVQIVGCSLVFIGACLGISLVADFYKHFSSPHGVMGFLVMLLVSVKLVGAIANLILGERLNSLMKTLDVIVAIVTIIIAYIAISIKYGDFNVIGNFGSSGWAITFAVLTMVSLLFMTGARVFYTGSINFE